MPLSCNYCKEYFFTWNKCKHDAQYIKPHPQAIFLTNSEYLCVWELQATIPALISSITNRRFDGIGRTDSISNRLMPMRMDHPYRSSSTGMVLPVINQMKPQAGGLMMQLPLLQIVTVNLLHMACITMMAYSFPVLYSICICRSSSMCTPKNMGRQENWTMQLVRPFLAVIEYVCVHTPQYTHVWHFTVLAVHFFVIVDEKNLQRLEKIVVDFFHLQCFFCLYEDESSYTYKIVRYDTART